MAQVTSLARERNRQHQHDVLVLARELRATGMPMSEALRVSRALLERRAYYSVNLNPAVVLPFRR